MPAIELVEGYRGDDEGINRRIAEIVDSSWGLDPDHAPAIEPTNPEDVREWFRDEDVETCLLIRSSTLMGFAMMYEMRDYTYLWMEVDLELVDDATAEIVGEEIVRWCSRARARRGFKKPIRASAGLEHGRRHRLFAKMFSHYIALEKVGATLMKLVRVPETIQVPQGFRVREGGVEDYRVVADIYNDAFSVYPWFREWSYDDAKRHLERRRPLLLIAETLEGEPAGFVAVRVFRALDGRDSAYVSTLAVARRFQRRGLGRALLAQALAKVLKQGVKLDRVFLDSVEGLEEYYGSLGFRGVRRYVSLYLQTV